MVAEVASMMGTPRRVDDCVNGTHLPPATILPPGSRHSARLPGGGLPPDQVAVGGKPPDCRGGSPGILTGLPPNVSIRVIGHTVWLKDVVYCIPVGHLLK
jgi:hypothetical protein